MAEVPPRRAGSVRGRRHARRERTAEPGRRGRQWSSGRTAVIVFRVFSMLAALGGLAMSASAAEDGALRQAVTFYASFDEKPAGDFGAGDLRLWTRADDP